MEKLTDEQVASSLEALGGWTLEEGRLVKAYTFAGFLEAMGFVNLVADLAEAHNHHPDIDIRYNRVVLGLYTHDVNGITRRDFKFAGAVDSKFGM